MKRDLILKLKDVQLIIRDLDIIQARMFACTIIFKGQMHDGNLRIKENGYLLFTCDAFHQFVPLSSITRYRKQRPKSLIIEFIPVLGWFGSVKYKFPSNLIRDTAYDEVKLLARNFLEDPSPLLSADEESESDDDPWRNHCLSRRTP